jgi:ATP-dependent DNA helicase RecQ
MQFKAGYIIDSIAELISSYRNTKDVNDDNDLIELNKLNGLLEHITSFDVDFKYEHNLDFKNLNSVLATINNIITRGLPTKAPVCLEYKFCEIGLTENTSNTSEIRFSNKSTQIDYNLLFNLLHITEPEKFTIERRNYGGKEESNLEWQFLQQHPFLIQILETQRNFETINRKLGPHRRVDFCFTSPYLTLNNENNRLFNEGRIIEVDGHQSHFLSEGKFYDNYRDEQANEFGFKTERVRAEDINSSAIDFEALFNSEIYNIYKENHERKIADFSKEYYLVFIPLAVARIQKTLIELLLYKLQNEPNFLKKDKIKIAIIERDIPCGAFAVKGLEELIVNINNLLIENDEKLKIPRAELTVYNYQKWQIDKSIHLDAKVENEEHFIKNEFDIILDHSILRRSNIYNENDFTKHKEKTIKIRSAHYNDTSYGISRRVYCAELLHYKELVIKQDDGSYKPIKELNNSKVNPINFFIQNIFRKVGFRDGQLPIISRALQQKPVIGLLPTGGGKSITYQLPVFLQPGICLVVDPIKSLMEDQVRVLKQNWIDCCDFINSNTKFLERKSKTYSLHFGETMFLFVSPERLVIKEFRHLIDNIDKSEFGLALSYCVIDEVHCVSEWGHDFRTTYLMLGKNAQKFARSKNEKGVTLIGLTATASFDVLTDIERELRIESNESSDAVISIDNTIRPELIFNLRENETRQNTFPINEQNLKDNIGSAKLNLLKEFYEKINDEINAIDEEFSKYSLEQHFTDFEIINVIEKDEKINNAKLKLMAKHPSTNLPANIIFCPHTKGSFGITNEIKPYPSNKEIFENLPNPLDGNKGYFMGSNEGVPKAVTEKAQKYFIQFLDDRIKTMVCTKAFGMGIDKEDIRVVNHFNFSSSPESYIQEAGRAGRDKGLALCNIYFDENIYYTINDSFILKQTNFNLISDRKNARNLIEEYGNLQNRIQKKYYGSADNIKKQFSNLNIQVEFTNKEESDIVAFNQDKSIHDFFHSNSFKGKETEIAQLKRLFEWNEGINTTRYKLLAEKYNEESGDNIKFKLDVLDDKNKGNLWLNDNDGNAFGKIFSLAKPLTFGILGLGKKALPDIIKTKEVFDFLINEWQEFKTDGQTFFTFLNENIVEGLNEGKNLKTFYDDCENDIFEFTIPRSFNPNDLETLIINDSYLQLNGLRTAIGNNSIQKYLGCLNDASYNFEDFIMRIEEEWNMNIFGTTIYNSNSANYKKLYYNEVKKGDVDKMIYRMYAVGLVEDYTIDYNRGLITLAVVKKDKSYYISATEKHMLKYLSKAETEKRINKLKSEVTELNELSTITKCIGLVLTFTYDDIVKKRKEAIDEMFNFITNSKKQANEIINSNFKDNNNIHYKNEVARYFKTNPETLKTFWFNHFLKDELYYYFNAKYARKGFKLNGIDYSLTDDTDIGKISKWEHFKKYAYVLNDQNRFIAECKMMRGSCRRIWRTLLEDDFKKEYTLKILYAYSTFGLNNKFYFEEAEQNLISGFLIYYKQNGNYIDLKEKITEFQDTLLKSTTNEKELLPYLDSARHHIMLLVNIEYTQNLNKQLQAI